MKQELTTKKIIIVVLVCGVLILAMVINFMFFMDEGMTADGLKTRLESFNTLQKTTTYLDSLASGKYGRYESKNLAYNLIFKDYAPDVDLSGSVFEIEKENSTLFFKQIGKYISVVQKDMDSEPYYMPSYENDPTPYYYTQGWYIKCH